MTQYEIQGIFLQREDSVGRQAWEAKLLQKSDGQLHQTCKGNEARHRSVRSRQGREAKLLRERRAATPAQE